MNSAPFEQLKEKIQNRKAKIAVIGLGYVGLPMCIEFARAGFHVTGIDTDLGRVTKIQKGESYVPDIPDKDIQAVSANFVASTDYALLQQVEVIVICVPTPLRKTKDPDLSFILSAASQVSSQLQNGQLIILESTTYPGTTEEIVLPELEKKGGPAGMDFFLAFSPERIDPGNAMYNIRNTPKIVGGITTESGALAQLLYETIVDKVVRVSSARSAEMVKLLENTFRAINIGMVNEVAIMCDKLGIDTWEVIDAAATKPFGFMPFYPGPGLGGHCIPVDPHYLAWKLKTLDYSARFIELAGDINSSMPDYVVTKVTNALNDEKKSVKGSRIVLLGTAYKKNSNDVRESPALDILGLLLGKKADVSYHDPYVAELKLDSTILKSQPFEPGLLQKADCVVIVTDHSSYDWSFVVEHSRLIVDTRNATRNVRSETCRIVKL